MRIIKVIDSTKRMTYNALLYIQNTIDEIADHPTLIRQSNIAPSDLCAMETYYDKH